MMKVLDSGDFTLFRKYVDGLTKKEKHVSVDWVCLRDLTPEFQEAVLLVKESVPDLETPSYEYDYELRVSVVATKKKIVYYEIADKAYQKAGAGWNIYYNPFEKHKDDKGFEELKTSFQNTYKANLNESELFVTDFVYGDGCGIAGTPPAGKKEIDKWVREDNKLEMKKWLTATNTEKQIYAIDGLLQLKAKGILLSKEEIEIMKYVSQKGGNIHVCDGCIYSQDSIENRTSGFKF